MTSVLLPRKAPLPYEVHKKVREETLHEHISKWTKIEEGDKQAKHSIDFGTGVDMKLNRFPVIPRRNDPLAEYGIPVSVRLLFKIVGEGSIVFLLMFLLCLPALNNNQQRSNYRLQCRRAATTPTGYKVLTNFNSTTAEERAEVSTLLWPDADPRDCGYDGLPIRRFVNTSLETLYQQSVTSTFLTTSLGACAEYRTCNTTLDESCVNAIQPSGPGVDGAELVRTPGAIYCLGFQPSATASQVTQFLAQLLFLAFLVRIRFLSQEYARKDDSARITTSDYSLAISGLNKSIRPDELRVQVKEQLEALEINGIPGYLTGKIHHVEVGRGCRAEVSVIKKLHSVTVRAEELTERMKYKKAERKDVKVEEAGLKELVTTFTFVQEEIKRLMIEEDTSTGHAFVAFHEELDRNKCYTHFIKSDGTKYGSAVGGPATLACANSPKDNSSKSTPRMVLEKVCGLQERRETLSFHAAPEPNQINWDALELDDSHEQKVVMVGRIVTTTLVLIGAACLLGVKAAAATFHVKPETGASSTATYLQEQAGKSALTALASLVTLFFNTFIKLLTYYLVRQEGQDTKTEEQLSIFSKLSIALTTNTVMVPLIVGLFLTGAVGDHSWYEPGGVVSSAALLMLFYYANDMALVFNAIPILKRGILSRFTYSETQLLEYWKPISFQMGDQYARCLNTMSLALVFGPIYPIAYIITAMGLVFKYFCARIAMKTWMGFPANIDQEMMMALRLRLGQMTGFGVIVQCCAIVQSVGLIGLDPSWSETGKQALDAASWSIFGTPVIVFLYAAVPLGFLSVFARFDQLEDTDTGETDTGGLRFDDAAEKTGYPMPKYVCPTLPMMKEDGLPDEEALLGLSPEVLKATEEIRRCTVLLTPYGLGKQAAWLTNFFGEVKMAKQQSSSSESDGVAERKHGACKVGAKLPTSGPGARALEAMLAPKVKPMKNVDVEIEQSRI